MQQQTIVYKIAKTITPLDPISSMIVIYVLAKEATGDELRFMWHYDPQTPTKWESTSITVSLKTHNLMDLVDKMHKKSINKQSQPEEVLRFLEENHILQAISIQLQPDQEDPIPFLITEAEMKTGTIKVNGKTYELSIQLQKELQKLKERRNIPAPDFQ